jgi:hypothetical protein
MWIDTSSQHPPSSPGAGKIGFSYSPSEIDHGRFRIVTPTCRDNDVRGGKSKLSMLGPVFGPMARALGHAVLHAWRSGLVPFVKGGYDQWQSLGDCFPLFQAWGGWRLNTRSGRWEMSLLRPASGYLLHFRVPEMAYRFAVAEHLARVLCTYSSRCILWILVRYFRLAVNCQIWMATVCDMSPRVLVVVCQPAIQVQFETIDRAVRSSIEHDVFSTVIFVLHPLLLWICGRLEERHHHRVYRSDSFQLNCSHVQFKIMPIPLRWQETARSGWILKVYLNIEEDYIGGRNENDLNAYIYLDLTWQDLTKQITLIQNLYTFLTTERIAECHLIIVSNGIFKILQTLCQPALENITHTKPLSK